MVDYTVRPAPAARGAAAARAGGDAHVVPRRVDEAVDAEGYAGQDEEEDDDYDGDYVVLFHHLGGCVGEADGER